MLDREQIRALGASERYFWAMNQVKPLNFTLVVSFKGTKPRELWAMALARVQRRHPLLMASVDEAGMFFVRSKGAEIPLAIKKREGLFDWQGEVAQGLAEPFRLAEGPLLRAVLLEDEQGCDLALTCLHLIGDGMSSVKFVRELMRAMAGEELQALSVPETAEALMDRIVLNGEHEGAPVTAEIPREYSFETAGRTPRVEGVRLTETETAQLLRAAKRKGVTAGSALLTALLGARRTLAPEPVGTGVRGLVTMDVHGMLGNEDDFSLSLSVATVLDDLEGVDFWERARIVGETLAPFRNQAAVEATFQRVVGMAAMARDPLTLAQIWAKAGGYDVLLSNLRVVEAGAMPEGLELEAIWGGVLPGVEGEQAVVAATVNGALHLTHSSYTPVRGLLGRARDELAAASASAA